MHISDDVAAAFAETNFTSWESIVEFANRKIKNRYGWMEDGTSSSFFDRAMMRDFGTPMFVETQNYMDLSMGGRYLQATNMPFPQQSGLLLSAQAMSALLLPLQVAEHLKSLWRTLIRINEIGVSSREGKEAMDAIYHHTRELKKIASNTTRDAISSIVPLDGMLARPDSREQLNGLISLALTGTVPVKVVDGIAHTVA